MKKSRIGSAAGRFNSIKLYVLAKKETVFNNLIRSVQKGSNTNPMEYLLRNVDNNGTS